MLVLIMFANKIVENEHLQRKTMDIKTFFRRDRWPSYVVGALIGVLSWITFGAMKKALGFSTTFVHIAAMVQSIFAPEHVKELIYYRKELAESPLIDWQFMLVIGALIGGWLGAWLSKSFFGNKVPKIWNERFGSSKVKLNLASFFGGLILMFGARLAGGCTSGHGLSGGITLAISSWIFLVSFFVSGIIFSQLVYKKK